MRDSLIQAGYAFDPGTQTWRQPGQQDIAYNDGDAAEQQLADLIARSGDLSVLSVELKAHIRDWHTLYHLSGQRANILRPLAAELAGADVLEIGAGCGAITRYLGQTAGRVLALDGTARRAAIARSRTRDLTNVEVVVDSFMTFRCERSFDVVTLIGVLEYAHVFSDAPDAAAATLRRACSLLKPGGRLVIAIENQLGLKYFAGANEDHLGMPAYGLEGRYGAGQPRTWGRLALRRLLAEAGFQDSEFLAPFPDYKLAVSIVTEAGWEFEGFDPGALASQSSRRDPQLPPLLGFAPERVWPEIDRNGLGMDLSNSFLVVAHPAPAPRRAPALLAYHFSTDRVPAFCKETHFVGGPGGAVDVRYHRLAAGVPVHEAVGIRFHVAERSDYVRGPTLAAELAELVAPDAWRIETVGQFLRRYLGLVAAFCASVQGRAATSPIPDEFPGSAFDLVPQNIIVAADGRHVVIDQEWSLEAPVPARWLALRALLLLANSVTRFGRPASDFPRTREGFVLAALAAAGLPASKGELDVLVRREAAVQSAVSGRPVEAFLEWGAATPLPLEDFTRAVASRELALAQLAAELAAERDKARKEIGRLHVSIAEIYASRSWRAGAPLRFAGLLAKGEYQAASSRLVAFIKRQLRRLPPGARARLMQWRTELLGAASLSPDTSTELSAIQPLVERRSRHATDDTAPDVLAPPRPGDWPPVDVSVVMYNNGRWLDAFVDSIHALDYPADRLRMRFVDNGSTDATPGLLTAAVERLRAQGIEASVLTQDNRGFGAGHNAGLRGGRAPYGLVTNVDLTFAPDALKEVVAAAEADPCAAAWELRQKPYEHPKYYDPVTGETNWNSHACVLLRRKAFEEVGGYDHHLFMYGEDVELSYRLRRQGWRLRYCPRAVVFHYSYETADQVKPLQYTGSTFANLYLRLKYGTGRQIAMVPGMALGLLLRPGPYPGARAQVAKNLARLALKVPAALSGRRSSDAVFPFRLWDYELRRDGAFHEAQALPQKQPLVSVITRTYRGREALLREAMLSVAHQSYPKIELVVVEDGGETLRPVVEAMGRRTGLRTRFVAMPKVGRSAAGNAGLAAASGKWCVFLDDDDLLFADHIEALVQALQSNPAAAAAYSLAWEVQTSYPQQPDQTYREEAYTVPPVLRQPFDQQLLSQHNFMAIQSVLFERRLYTERGGLDEDIDALEDWILWNVYAHGNTFEYVAKTTSLFRTPADPQARQRRNQVFGSAYEAARRRFAARIADLALRDEREQPDTVSLA